MICSFNIFVHAFDNITTFKRRKKLLLQLDILVDLVHVLTHGVNGNSNSGDILFETVSKCFCTVVECCLEAINNSVKCRLKLVNGLMETGDGKYHTHVKRRHQLSLNEIIELVFVFLNFFSRLTSFCIILCCERQAKQTS